MFTVSVMTGWMEDAGPEQLELLSMVLADIKGSSRLVMIMCQDLVFLHVLSHLALSPEGSGIPLRLKDPFLIHAKNEPSLMVRHTPRLRCCVCSRGVCMTQLTGETLPVVCATSH